MDTIGILQEKECLVRSRAVCLENIRALNVWGSDLHDISIVRKMINIEVLNLSANNISSLEDLSYCPRIKEIYLRKNKISSISELRFLKNLPNLQVLWLSDNPCTENNNYKQTVLKNLPKLKKLDSNEVTNLDLDIAKENGILISNDKDIPVYDELDLDKTLTADIMKNFFLQLNVQEEKKQIKDQMDEKEEVFNQPVSNEEINNSNQNGIDERGVVVINDSVPNEEINNSSHNSLDSSLNDLQHRQKSNTMAAILLLMEDLNEEELCKIKTQTEALLALKSDHKFVSESLLVD